MATDLIDRRIIALLQRDGRTSHLAMARALGVAEATARRRIKRLLDTGIVRVVALPNPEAMGLTVSAIIGLSCDLRKLDEIAETIAGFSETRYLGYATGTFDIVVEAFFYSHQHLLEFLTRKVAAIPGVIKTESNVILKVAKFSFEWEVPVEELESLSGRSTGA